MTSPVRKLVLVGLLVLLAVMPVPRRHTDEATVRADRTVDLTPVRQADGSALRAVDDWYAYAAAHPTTTTTTVPQQEGNVGAQQPQERASYDGNTVAQLILDVFGAAGPKAVDVAECESSFDPYAENGRFRGIFQIGDMHAEDWRAVTGYSYWSSWMMPDVNVAYAFSLYQREGWKPWECA